jgi:uncharacterized membrane protein
MEHQDEYQRGGESLSKALGWFSIGLGLTELLAPDVIRRVAGLGSTGSPQLVRALGAREFGNGVAILAAPDRAPRVWTRVGGDAIDLAVLGTALNDDGADRGRVSAAMAAVLGVTALDVLCATRLSRRNGNTGRAPVRSGAVRVELATTINRPIDEVYSFWRNFQNFPRFMRHLESVEITGERTSRWRAKGPAGTRVEWDADMIVDREDWIAWRSMEGADVQNSGSVRFQRAPGVRGTEVRVQLEYHPPAGALGRGVAWIFGEEPEQQIHEDLHRAKQLMETGEVPLSDGPGLSRPAQPAADPRQVKSLAGVQS